MLRRKDGKYGSFIVWGKKAYCLNGKNKDNDNDNKVVIIVNNY